MDNCLFCAIACGKIPSQKIFESDHLYAFLDIAPANKGHALLIPKSHCSDLLGLDPAFSQEIIEAMQRIARAIVSVTNAQGFNIVQNNGRAAGQEIDHLHWHIIPRFDDDGLKLWRQGKYDSDEEMGRLATAIRVQIGR
ncbi:MAG: HIT family protein [Desulfovibrio sp.]|nr:HIT family protein [Desulfovibrio sp.]